MQCHRIGVFVRLAEHFMGAQVRARDLVVGLRPLSGVRAARLKEAQMQIAFCGGIVL